jgi:Dolichyl-phosphate-mannose-protein mannosyltransferase
MRVSYREIQNRLRFAFRPSELRTANFFFGDSVRAEMSRESEQVKTAGSMASELQPSRVTWLLAAILALALGLRLWGISFGLPYDLTFDEPHEIHRALALGAGEYYWQFGKGALYYILFLEYGLLYGLWWIMGRVNDTDEFAVQIIRDPSILYLLGRVTVAIMGTLTCLVVFQIGRRLYDWRVGLATAVIGVTSFVHVDQSHIISVDIGMTLAAWTGLLAYLEYEKSRAQRWLISAGALVGLSVAFKLTGGIMLLVLFLAIMSRADNRQHPSRAFKEGALLLVAMIAVLTIVAPEWTEGFTSGGFFKFVVYIFGGGSVPVRTFEGDIKHGVELLTILRRSEWTSYIDVLLEPRNLALTMAALFVMGLGVIRRQRWSIIWMTMIVVFLTIMSSSIRDKPEHYLLPIMPAFWLLGGQAIAALAARHRSLLAGGLACVTIPPLFAIVRQNVEWTKADTRVIAKEWIEANIRTGSKILIDGFQHRFVASPPLRPDRSTIQRQIGGNFEGRNQVSQHTLKLYAEAMGSTDGPSYELHSTQWGFSVQDPDYYIQACFDYIITSSTIGKLYQDDISRQRFPRGARFYEQLEIDPHFRKIYSVEPIPWQRPGPIITVYRVIPTCRGHK